MTVSTQVKGQIDLNGACSALAGNTVQSITLHQKQMKQEEVARLAKALMGNQSLTSLDITKTGIKPLGLVILGKPLAGHPKLRRLELPVTAIKNGISGFLEALRGSTTLKELEIVSQLRSKIFYPIDGTLRSPSLIRSAFPNKTLTFLNLAAFNEKMLEPEDAIKKLDFSIILSECVALKHLNLSKNHIQSDVFTLIVSKIFKNTTLESLDLSENPLLCRPLKVEEEEGVHWAYFADLGGIQKLGLALQKNSKSALTKLSLNHLTHQRIGKIERVGEDIRRIVQFSKLKSLEIVGERMSPANHYKIQMALRMRKDQDFKLVVSSNFLPPSHSKASDPTIESIVGKLKEGKLVKLDLSKSKLTPADFFIIGAALKENKTLQELNVSENDLSKNRFSGLRDLCLGFLEHRSIKKIAFRKTKLDDSAASVVVTLLSYNSSITEVDLGENRITSVGLQQFLCRLPFPNGPVVPFASLRDTANWGISRRSEFKTNGEFLNWFKNTYSGVEVYSLEETPVKQSFFLPVCEDQMHTLECLDLSRNPIFINRLYNKKYDGAESRVRTIVEEILTKNTTLRRLNLSDPPFGWFQSKTVTDKHLQYFADALNENKTLQFLGLEGYVMNSKLIEEIKLKLQQNLKHQAND